MWTDSHCHAHDEDDPEALLREAAAGGVGRVVVVGTDADQSRRAVDVAVGASAAGLSDAYATVGLHPHDAVQGTDGVAGLLGSLSAPEAGRVVGVGECGLDYHYDHSPRATQRQAFAEQVALAAAHDLTLVVHTREAWDDTFGVLAEVGVPERVVLHCFTGGPEEARRCLDLGAFLSFSGIVSFAKAADVREAARICPADRLMVETDSPYLAPVPHRGRRNRPVWVTAVGAAVAELRQVALGEVERSTTEAASAAFRLPLQAVLA
ncbi:MAG TPA: TatD family hydrolase [Acidimicrobiales bacterium]|nr:TatD family hydrolase [Acidimicrobiales bacterium]